MKKSEVGEDFVELPVFLVEEEVFDWDAVFGLKLVAERGVLKIRRAAHIDENNVFEISAEFFQVFDEDFVVECAMGAVEPMRDVPLLVDLI